jgi:hypothetical protein
LLSCLVAVNRNEKKKVRESAKKREKRFSDAGRMEAR